MHMARWTKLSVLIHYLQILKTVDVGRKDILAKEQAEEHEEALSYTLSAMGIAGIRQTHRLIEEECSAPTS